MKVLQVDGKACSGSRTIGCCVAVGPIKAAGFGCPRLLSTLSTGPDFAAPTSKGPSLLERLRDGINGIAMSSHWDLGSQARSTEYRIPRAA